MEKFLKRIRIIAILIITILIIVVGFFGIYIKNNGVWTNALPEYNLGMELSGYRELHFELDTTEETKDVYVDENGNYKGDVIASGETDTTSDVAQEEEVSNGYTIENRTIAKNDSSKINIENFEKAKKIIQKRLEKYDLYEYNLRQDSVTGKIVLEVPDDENVDLNISLVATIGSLQFVDAETGLILLDDSNLTSASPYGRTNESGEYEVYLQLSFDEEGTEILQKITEEYIQTVDATGNSTSKKVEVRLDDQAIVSTYFSEAITSGIVHVPMGDATTDYNEYYELAENVQEVCNIINEENLPLYYEITDDVKIQSVITDNVKTIVAIICAVILLVISVYMVIRYKFEGLRQAILSIGYLATLAIMLRYTNVRITINSVIALVGVAVINYIFAIKFLNKFKKENNRKIALKGALRELYLTILPVAIIAVVFTFMPAVVINSVGMTLFWGLLLQLLFSLITLV